MMDDTGSDTLATMTPSGEAGDGGGQAPLPGYELGGLIGRGGMGEVVAARDPSLGRDVAIKRMKATSPTPEAIERFLREAKVQARLDHPAIAPVYELGHDGDGLPYFTMKRVAGTTMTDVIKRGHARQRLLPAFVDVCLAIELAHSRQIAHRDLKPANIMLGNYGEVHILDWGIARLLDEAAEDSEKNHITMRERQRLPDAVLGTPGYMAPEQAQGEPCSPATDVYALGCILFEILVGTPLHPSGLSGIDSAIDSPTTPPSARAPNVPPELDAACVAALAADPTSRPTARELGERVQRYLEGDRDHERRCALAAELLAQAMATTDHDNQMQLAGRALALDPESKQAAALVTRLMLEPPEDIPPELARAISRSELEQERRAAGLGIASLAATFVFLPIVLWMGVTDLALFAGTYALVALMIALVVVQRRWVGMGRRVNLYPLLVGIVVLAASISRYFAPFVLVPLALIIIAVGMMAQPSMQHRPAVVLAICCLGFVAPLALEATGVLGSTWQVQDGAVVLRSTLVHLGGVLTQLMLIGATLVAIVIAGLFSRGLAIAQRDAVKELQLQRWRLMQLVPEAVRR
jgi:serine/threonine-protein kinase